MKSLLGGHVEQLTCGETKTTQRTTAYYYSHSKYLFISDFFKPLDELLDETEAENPRELHNSSNHTKAKSNNYV